MAVAALLMGKEAEWVSGVDELLAAVDVEGGASDGGVGHDVEGEGGDVGGTDDAADGQGGAQVLAAGVELIAEELRREGRIDEAGGDEVDAHGSDFEGEILRHGGHGGGESRDKSESLGGAAATDAADEEQSAARTNFVDGVTSDVQREKQMRRDVVARPDPIEFGERGIVGTGAGEEQVVDGGGQFAEELREAVEVGGVEGYGRWRGGGCGELAGCLLKTPGIARGEHKPGAFRMGQPGGFQADAGAASDDDDGLSGELRFPAEGRGRGGAHDSSSACTPDGAGGILPQRFAESSREFSFEDWPKAAGDVSRGGALGVHFAVCETLTGATDCAAVDFARERCAGEA